MNFGDYFLSQKYILSFFYKIDIFEGLHFRGPLPYQQLFEITDY